MDKVKIALAVLKKYHFWFLCGLILLVSFGVSAVATSDLETRLEDETRQLKSGFDSVQNVSYTSPHPNPTMIDEINSRTQTLKQDVFAAWEILYEEQDKKNQLAAALTDDFKREFYNRDSEISPRNLEHYQNFIPDRFETLFNDVLNVRRKEVGEGGNTPDAPAPRIPADARGLNEETKQADDMIGVVKWDGHLSLKEKYDWQQRPTTETVRRAQENLWVYEALFRVIRNTNSDPDATEEIEHHNAAIKEIYSLEIGADAGGGTQTTSSASADESVTVSPYVDQNGQPLTADSSGAAEYNIMPIRMLVSIDQTKIPKLLVECANSNMPIEVRSVRIRPGNGQTLNLGEITSTVPTKRPLANAESDEQTGAKHIPVAVEGLIYIYNPPDQETLGTGAIAESSDTTTESATDPYDEMRD